MLNLDKMLAQLDTYTVSEINEILKDALVESGISYSTTHGLLPLEDIFPPFCGQGQANQIEIDLSPVSSQETKYVFIENEISLSFDISSRNAITYSVPINTGSATPLKAA